MHVEEFTDILISSLVKSHNRSFLRKQESRETKEKTGFPLKNCGNDGNISNVALPLNYLVVEAINREKQIKGWTRQKKKALIAGDYEMLAYLSKSHPSTGSG